MLTICEIRVYLIINSVIQCVLLDALKKNLQIDKIEEDLKEEGDY